MARTLIAGPDAFTAADDTAVSTYSANWKELDNAFGILKVFSNSYRNNGSVFSDCSWQGAGTFTGDQYAAVTLVGSWTGADSDCIGVSLRNSGQVATGRDMYRVYFSPTIGGVRVDKVVNDTATQIGTTITATFTTNDVLIAEAVTNGANVDIIVYKNGGAAIGTRSDTSSVLTGGKPGITALASANLIRGDLWEGGNVTTATGSLITRRSGDLAGGMNSYTGGMR